MTVRRIAGYGIASVALAIVVGALLAFNASLSLVTVALGLMLLVMVAAVAAGRGVALYVAVLAGLAFNFFFIPPFHTFRIERIEDTVAFLMFIITAVIVGQLSSRLEMRVLQAEVQERKLQAAEEDVSARATEAAMLRKSEQLKTALLDAVTHDLRTPLTSIKAAVTTVQRRELPLEVRHELYEVIEQECDRLDRFIGGMMDLARLETGNLHPESAATTTSEIMEAALDRATPLLAHHRVEVQAESPGASLLVDARLMSQVLFTLLENAAKNSPAGSRILLSASSKNGHIQFSVGDEGPGVPEQLREQVFEKFFRIGDRAGYGVGLAIARGIVQAHNGRIWIESGVGGRGANVKIELAKAE